MKKVSLKADQYRTDERIILFKDMETGMIQSGKHVYIDGPCKSVYEVDEKIGEWRIVWLETDSPVRAIRDDEEYIPGKIKIRVDTKAIRDNCKYNKSKEHEKFHKILHVNNNGDMQSVMIVEINGPSRVIYDPNNKEHTVWIETNSEIKTVDVIT
jgi:hypothetical protein